ncbi:unnamed protein product [Citrullus colocynthis]|uniref:Uncharacterized protein n=1 Tax=Citrullus colocynthis TaxID=252529 RepID=A0ABP0Y7U0_9ROSI
MKMKFLQLHPGFCNLFNKASMSAVFFVQRIKLKPTVLVGQNFQERENQNASGEQALTRISQYLVIVRTQHQSLVEHVQALNLYLSH